MITLKKILYITNIPAPYTVEFFNDLGLSFDLTVVFEGRNSSERDKSWDNFEAVNFKYLIIDDKKSFTNFRMPTGIRKILHENTYDLYIVGNYSTPTGMYCISWFRSHKLPYAIHADGGLISKDSFIKFHVKKHFLKKASLYFSSGKMTTEYFVYYGADKSKVFEYPFSSIRLNQIRNNLNNDYYRDKLGLSLNERIVVSVGQMIYRKGFDVLINALSQMETKVKVYIIGGNATDELNTLIDELNLDNIEFINFLPFETILDYMAAADLFVLLTREDIWGLVINEAMSMGTPVISTDRCVAAVEMIENGINGYVVETENAKSAAEYMDLLINDDVLRKKIQNSNIEKAKLYTIESMTKSYVDIINKFLYTQEQVNS